MTYVLDVLIWCWCRFAFFVIMHVPWPETMLSKRKSPAGWLMYELLPFAGFYAYREPEEARSWRWFGRYPQGAGQ